jgi:metal-sulfur cluster biosynthetic enzyme/ribosomal protein L22
VTGVSVPLAAEWHVEEQQLRVTEHDGRTALAAVIGRPVIAARARLRFGPGRTCEPVARLLDRAIVRAETAGLDPELLVVADGSAQAGEDIIRVRRKAHGVADWIRSPACQVRITLRPAGLHAVFTAGDGPVEAARAEARVSAETSTAAVNPPARVSAETSSVPVSAETSAESAAGAAAVRAALSEVIDPDLGVNIVDLGFVRAVAVRDRTAVITMTLTSAACPLTGILENQIRTELGPLGCVEDFRIDWQWIPAWSPADITDDGRDQLRAIGFTI